MRTRLIIICCQIKKTRSAREKPKDPSFTCPTTLQHRHRNPHTLIQSQTETRSPTQLPFLKSAHLSFFSSKTQEKDDFRDQFRKDPEAKPTTKFKKTPRRKDSSANADGPKTEILLQKSIKDGGDGKMNEDYNNCFSEAR